MKKFNLAVCGGTFEYFHEGHKSFLRFALSKANNIIIGLTSDLFVKKAKKGTILSFKQRKETLEKFLKEEKALQRVKIISIDNIYIPKSVETFPIEAIIVTKDSLWGAKAINKKRISQDLPSLQIIICPLLKVGGKPVSSSKIRKSLNFSKTLFLPDDLRPQLKKPMGTLIKNFDAWIKKEKSFIVPSMLITVGDVITKACNDLSLQQKFSIIDFYVQRKRKFTKIAELGFSGKEEVFLVRNKAGTITPALFRKVKTVFNSKSPSRKIIVVAGEEDLAVLPCMINAAYGSVILYGQPNQGVVKIEVSKKTKAKALNIIRRFK